MSCRKLAISSLAIEKCGSPCAKKYRGKDVELPTPREALILMNLMVLSEIGAIPSDRASQQTSSGNPVRHFEARPTAISINSRNIAANGRSCGK
jgi:hypothetical protein